MLIIGECIHIVAPAVKEAVERRDAAFIQDLARRQVEAGAGMLDLNIGPQKKHGTEVMPWIVETVQAVTDVPLSLDTTNLAAMEAGLAVCARPALLNSASADPDRCESVMRLAAAHGAGVIALTLGRDGIPTTTDGRAELAMDMLLPNAEGAGLAPTDLYIDPLALTVTCNQDVAMVTVDSIRIFKQIADPPPMTTIGLSNVSNGCAEEVRSLINRAYLVMLLGAGLDCAIADPFDDQLKEWVRIVEERDEGTPLARLVLALHDVTATMDDLDADMVDPADEQQVALYKTYRMLRNEIIYADSFLHA
jgi:5-methyltetrahydrofolate corrinoid/iron sulfur protein methyltransferase